MKKWLRAIILAVVFAFIAVGCGSPESGGHNPGTNPGGKEDEYVDYVPDKKPGGGQFDFDGNYSAPELTMDGKGDDEQWKAITEPLARFGNGDGVTVKAYRGEVALFFLFEVPDTVLLTEGNSNDDSVTRSDSIEVYIDTLANGGSKPQSDDYQINLGIHGKTRIMQGAGGQWGNWNGLIDYEVFLNGTLNDGEDANDTGYGVEVMIPYSQIGIQKDDTIAVSFGQVDKFKTGNTVNEHWKWYGWTFDNKFREPQTPNNYVLLDKDNVLTDRDKQFKPDAEVVGYVIDSATKAAVSGATVSVNVNDEIKTTVTDGQGYYTLGKLNPEQTYTVTVSKQGYIGNEATYTRAELREANGGRVLKTVELQDESGIAKTTVTGVVKNIVNGIVEGATVRADGTTISAVTDASGAFTLTGVPAEQDVTLIVTKEGYGESKTLIAQGDITADGTTAAGDVNINLPYGNTSTFGLKNNFFANSTMDIARSLTGIEMHLSGTRRFSGKIEIYLDTKESGTDRNTDSTCWRFDLNDNGSVSGQHYTTSFNSEGLVYNLFYSESDGYKATFFIPYDYLGITPLEVFGISLGQWSETAKDWDGWGYDGFIAPENPSQYVRINALNQLYKANNNNSMVTLSGNAGQSGVTVKVGSATATSDKDGNWSIRVAASSASMVVEYSKVGYKSHTTIVEAGYFDTHFAFSENITLIQHLVTVKGKVTDSTTGAAIAGVTVETQNGTLRSVVTDANGDYVIEDMASAENITLRFSKDDYAAGEETLTVATLATKDEHTLNVSLTSTAELKFITLTGTVQNVNGKVEGAAVTVEGNSALNTVTDENGVFTIENFPCADVKITVSKKGYISEDISFKANGVEESATSFNVGTIDFKLEYTAFNGLIADKADTFAHFKGYVTRSATGFEFKFVGSKAFTGRIELFVDTKTSAGDNARDTSDYLFNLNADGNLTIVNWGDGVKNETKPENMVLKVLNADTAPEVYFTLPYAFFGQRNQDEGITSTEVIGISAGQYNGSDWDGWDNFALPGANGAPFVKPEMPQDYVRIGAHNEMYAKADNTTLNLYEYDIRFAVGENTDTPAGARPVAVADDFRAKVVSRDETGVTFEFITTGDFNKEGEQNEMVLIYFDTGAAVDGWDNVDYLIKISSDGTVYGKAGSPWWSATDADKIGEPITVTRDGGVTKFTYKVLYSTIGIEATDVFGIAMREASHNAGDYHLYDPYYDCYFDGTRVDAANSSQYIRVAADGTLYKAASNSAAQA